MGFVNSVLAPSVAASFFSPIADFSGSSLQRSSYSSLRATIAAKHNFQPPTQGINALGGRWSWNDIELYGTEFKVAFDYAHDAQGVLTWFAGKFPDRTQLEMELASSGVTHHLDSTQARGLFSEKLRIGSWNLPAPQPVIFLRENEPEAWWKIKILNGARIFWLRESDGFWGEEPPLELQADATALLFRENKYASSETGLEEIVLTDLLDISYLRNKFFRVLNCMGKRASYASCGNFARSSVGRYTFPFESAEYSEMAGYYSVQKAMSWHRGIQSEEQKKVFGDFALAGPLDVFTRADRSDGPSYSPRSASLGTSNPVIYVNVGNEREDSGIDNDRLSFLTKDSDVLFHEFSHHVIYRSVVPKSTYSQSRSLQEGLADYFAYAISGNNQLGESIFRGRPLREGNLTINLSRDLFEPAEGFDVYYLGSLLSSTLWSLRTTLGDWKNGYRRIDKIVWDAIDLLPELATYYQFACAVVKQAAVFEKGENIPAGSLTTPILDAFAARRFFENSTPNPSTGCPAASSVLQDVDLRESNKSELPPIVKSKDPVVFTGDGQKALPPFAGSLYQPLQPRRLACGDLAFSSSKREGYFLTLFWLFAPFSLFIGSMIGKFFRLILNRR